MAATLISGGTGVFDGKKRLTVTSYDGTLDISKLKDSQFETTVKGSSEPVPAASVSGSFDATKITEIDASGASGLTIVTQGTKATSVTLNGGQVTGSSAADKFYGSTEGEIYILNGGSDVIGDSKIKNSGIGDGDQIVLKTGTDLTKLTFADALKSGVLTTTIVDAEKNKITVMRNTPDTPIILNVGKADATGKSRMTYGTDGNGSKYGSDGKTLTILNDSDGDGVINASTLASGLKIIDARSASGVYVIGNGQSDVISVAGGSTVSGGYDAAKNKATSDNIYADNTEGRGAITFAFDANAGADNVYNFKTGDTISLAGALNLSDTKKIKDGGYGKDLSFTDENGAKVTLKLNTAPYVDIIANKAPQRYGVDLGTNVSVNAKKTALVIGAEAVFEPTGETNDSITSAVSEAAGGGTSVSLTGWKNYKDTNALLTYAPKINEIDASAATGNFEINAIPTVASVLRGGTSRTTLVGGTGNDQMYGGSGVDVFVVNSSAENAKPGKDVIDEYGAGDFIVVKGGIKNDNRTDSIELSSKGVLTFSDDKTDQKNNTVTIKNFKKLGSTPVVVADESGKILAVNSNSGVPAPLGMDATAKAGITTTEEFNGQYAANTYVKGATVELSSGSTDPNNNLGLDGTKATIDANTYGGNAKAVIASVVGSGLTGLVIKGNATAKNTIYTPVRAAAEDGSGTDINVTVHGGTANDTFIGNSTATKTKVTYVFDGSGKDVIQGYNEGDVIFLQGVTSLSNVKSDANGESLANDTRITEKGSDVTFTDGKNTLTIKNAAGKALTFQIADKNGNPVEGKTYTYGHTLPDGLVYDSKQTGILTDAAVIAESDTKLATIKETGFNIDLTETTVGKGQNYYGTIKTVSLTGAGGMIANVSGNSLANELYAGPAGATLYGGDPGSKADADKLYGNTGADTFVYKYGGGADVIGDSKKAGTTLDESDTVVLRSNTKNVLKRDEVTITDKGKVITVQYNGTDAAAKASKLTINKDSEATPIHFKLDDSLSAVNDTAPSFVYGISDDKFRADAAAFAKNNLIITDTAGELKDDVWDRTKAGDKKELGTKTVDKSSYVEQYKVDVDVNNISSALKNIQVTADSDVAVSIVGGLSALNVSLGAGGGTVQGGYQDTNGKIKTFNDKFYADATTSLASFFVLEDETGGKDNVYNYDATRGDTILFKLDKVKDGATAADILSYLGKLNVKFSNKSIAFTYDSKTKSSLTLNAPSGSAFAFDTNIKIGFTDGTHTTKALTYYGWDSKKTALKDYANSTVTGAWTSPEDNVYVYEGDNEDNANHYGEKWIVRGTVQDHNGDYQPDGIIESNFNITGFRNTEKKGETNTNLTAVYVDEQIDNFHIGHFTETTNAEGEVTRTSNLNASTKLSANGLEYTLQDVDFDSDNGLELTYKNFVKLSNSGDVAYFSEFKGTKDEDAVGLGADFTLKSTIADPQALPTKFTYNSDQTTVENQAYGYLAKFSVDTTNDDKSVVKIDATSQTSFANAHFILPLTDDNRLEKANEYAKYTIEVQDSANNKETVPATYKLYDGDGNAANGYEFLRIDLANAAGWNLVTGEQATQDGQTENVQNQANGTGYWNYDSVTAEVGEGQDNPVIKFSVDSDAGIKASADGLPNGISVSKVNSLGAVDSKRPANNKYTVVTFDNSKFDTKYFHFDKSSAFGKDETAVHVKGLAVGTEFSVEPASGKDSDVYVLADLDGISANGLELLKVEANSGWTYNAGAWTFDNRKIAQANEEGEGGWNENLAPAVVFTISAQASIKADENGKPEGITVYYDTETGKVSKINFTPLTEAAHNVAKKGTNTTDTSLVTFASLPTGDIDNTVHIVGFTGYDSKAKKVTTVNVGSEQYYLVNLQADTDADADAEEELELLKVNKNWLLQDGQWEYYKNGVPTAIEAVNKRNPDLKISVPEEGDESEAVLPPAAIDGSPRGIAISGDNITIKSNIGVIDSDVSTAVAKSAEGEVSNNDGILEKAGSAPGNISVNMLTFASTTGVNKSSIHILPLEDDGKFIPLNNADNTDNSAEDVAFQPSETVTIDIATATNKVKSDQKFVFADLDRDSSNGYELLPVDEDENDWTYNSGKIKIEGDDGSYTYTYTDSDTSSALGSWSYTAGEGVKLGGSENVFTFDILPAANLYAKSVIDGTPENVTVEAEEGGATIKANGIALTNFAFSKEIAEKAFISDTGVHFIGFSENQTIAVDTGDKDEDDNKIYNYYRLKDLDGTSTTGLEMLEIEDRDRWVVTTAVDSKSKNTTRAWTYNGTSDTDTGFNLAISAVASLEAVNGKPKGVDIELDAGADDAPQYAKITFNNDVFKPEGGDAINPSTITLTNAHVGSGTSLHILGFDTDTTLNVNGSAYRLTDLDGNDNGGRELLKVDANWRYYGEEVMGDNAHGAKTWTYTYASITGSGNNAKTVGSFSFELDADAGLDEDGNPRNVAADANGKPIGITVEGGKLNPTITIDTDTLNVVSSSNIQNITFKDETTGEGVNSTLAGATGIHIKGIDSDTSIGIKKTGASNATQYYLVDLDGNTSNGYELAERVDNWERTATGWTYTNKTESANATIEFDINRSVAESGGKPVGVTVDGNIITFASSTKVVASDLRFRAITPGNETNGVHIIGLKLNDDIYVKTDEEDEDTGEPIYTAGYKLKELNENSSTGLELLANNDDWTMTNATVKVTAEGGGTENKIARTWTFDSDTVKFTVNPGGTVSGSAMPTGLDVLDASKGTPKGIAVTAIGDGEDKTYTITFSDVGNDGKRPSLDMLKIEKMPTGVEGVHISGATVADDATAEEGAKKGYEAYTTDTTKMFTISSKKYYLADIDGNDGNGYELLQNDAYWHRNETGWEYNDTKTKVHFTVDMVLEASDTGVPKSISVNSGKITFKGNEEVSKEKAASKLVFQSDTDMAKVHMIFANEEGVVDTETDPYASTFKYQKSANAEETVSYYVAHTDNTANDWELVKEDANWHRYDNGWAYTIASGNDDDNGGKVNFFLTSTKPAVVSSDSGVPSGITVSNTTIYFDASKTGLTQDQLASNLLLLDTKIKSSTVKAYSADNDDDGDNIRIDGLKEGANIKVNLNTNSTNPTTMSGYNTETGSVTFQLYNADGKVGTDANGLELTYGGWISLQSNDSNKNEYKYVSGLNTDVTKNVSLHISGDGFSATNKAKLEQDDNGKWSLNKVTGVATGGITLDSSYQAFTVKEFHAAKVGNIGGIGDGATVKATDGEDKAVTFTLKNVDSNTSDFELTNKGWAKANGGYFYYDSGTTKFTLAAASSDDIVSEDGATKVNKDSNNDLIPDTDFVRAYSTAGVTLTSDNVKAQFTFADALPKGFSVRVWDGSKLLDASAYDFVPVSDNSNTYHLVEHVDTPVEGGGSQLPATGYDLDDLINPTTAADADISTELDEILEIKPLAATNAFDTSELFTDIGGSDKSLASLTYAARHKDRK